MTQVDNIKYMESILNEGINSINDFYNAVDKLKALEGKIKELSDYYESKQWLKDINDDSKDKFPSTLERGVLSEDGIYNLLEDYYKIKESIKDLT